MERGAAEVVAAAAARLGPARVALDFDRTLATTRAGSDDRKGTLPKQGLILSTLLTVLLTFDCTPPNQGRSRAFSKAFNVDPKA